MGFTRSSSGLIRFDAFGSDTSGDYDGTATLSVSGGLLRIATAGFFVYPTTAGVKCATVRALCGSLAGGPVINANASMDATADRDYYRLDYSGTDWLLRRYISNSASTLATSATPDHSSGDYRIARVYVADGVVYATFGATALSTSISASDSTYASGYGGGVHGDGNVEYRKFDWLDFRTAHTITCTGMTTGHYLRVSDGTTAAEAAESSGTATVDAGAVLFPLASVQIRTAAAGGGDLIAELDTGDYADMGGGDAFAYSGGAATGWLPFMRPQYHPSFGGLTYG